MNPHSARVGGRGAKATLEDSRAPVAKQSTAPGEELFRLSRLGRDSLIYGVGILLSKAIAFVMLPIYTRFLTPADYGILELVQMSIEVVSIIAGAQLAAGIFRFYHKAESDEDRRSVLSTSLVLLLVTYGFAAAISFQMAAGISRLVFETAEHAGLIRIAAASLAFSSLVLVPFAFLRASHRAGTFVTVNLLKLVLQLSLNLLFVVRLGMGARGVLLSTFIANVLLGLGLAVFIIREVGFRFSGPAARDLLRFGVPLMATQAATFLATFGDRYFLQRAADSTIVGLYTLAYQFGFLLVVLGYLPFHLAWDPARFALAQLPREERDPVYARAFIRASVLLLTMAVLLALFVGDFLRIMAAPAFHPAAQLVPVLLVAYVLKSWTDFHNLGILVRERTEFQTLADWVGAVTALAGFAWFIPRYHAAGAAGVTVAAFAVRYALVYLVSQRLWPVRYEWGRVWRLVAIASAAALAGIAVSVRSLWLSIGVNALLFGSYTLGVWFLGILAPGDRARLRAAARRVSQLPTMLRSHARMPQTSLRGEGEASS